MRLLGCSWRVTEALDVFAGEARGDSWLALNLRVVAITARTSGAKASRLAPLERSRAEKDPLKTASNHDCVFPRLPPRRTRGGFTLRPKSKGRTFFARPTSEA
jgi:hypothetical protein